MTFSIPTLYELGGLLVSVVATVLTYLKSSEESRNRSSVFVGFLGVIVTMLISLRFDALPQLERSVREAVDRTTVAAATGEFQGAEAALTVIQQNGHPLMRAAFGLRLVAMQEQINAIKNGQFVVTASEMSEIVMPLIDCATKSFVATSYVAFKDWWDLAWGLEYERRNCARAHEIQITRVFILKDEDDLEAATSHLERQAAAGIDVRYVMRCDLDKEIAHDMVVIDGNVVAGELALLPEREMQAARFYTNETDVTRIRSQLARVLSAATKFKSAEAALTSG